MTNDQPASIPVAAAGVLSTGVAMFALFIPELDVAAQAVIIAFGNSVIALGVAIWLNKRTTSSTAPVVESGTVASIIGTEDKVVVQPTPPGPIGVEAGGEPMQDAPTGIG